MIFNKELHANKPQIKVNSRALCSIGGSVDVRHHLQHYLLQCPITIYLHLLKTLAAFFIPLLHSINFNQNPKHNIGLRIKSGVKNWVKVVVVVNAEVATQCFLVKNIVNK